MASFVVEGAKNVHSIPYLVITCSGPLGTADRVIKKLIAGEPSIHTDPFRRAENRILVNPICIPPEQAVTVGEALLGALTRYT